MKLKFVYNAPKLLLFGNKAHVIFYPYILFKLPQDQITDRQFRHEMEHVYQIRREGWLGFFSSYIAQLIKHGYKGNKWEVWATQVHYTPLTDEERRLKNE